MTVTVPQRLLLGAKVATVLFWGGTACCGGYYVTTDFAVSAETLRRISAGMLLILLALNGAVMEVSGALPNRPDNPSRTRQVSNSLLIMAVGGYLCKPPSDLDQDSNAGVLRLVGILLCIVSLVLGPLRIFLACVPQAIMNSVYDEEAPPPNHTGSMVSTSSERRASTLRPGDVSRALEVQHQTQRRESTFRAAATYRVPEPKSEPLIHASQPAAENPFGGDEPDEDPRHAEYSSWGGHSSVSAPGLGIAPEVPRWQPDKPSGRQSLSGSNPFGS